MPFSFEDVFSIYNYSHMSVWELAHSCQCLQKSEVTDTPGTGFVGIFEPSDMCAGNQTWVICNNGVCSELLTHPSRPNLCI